MESILTTSSPNGSTWLDSVLCPVVLVCVGATNPAAWAPGFVANISVITVLFGKPGGSIQL